MAEPTGTLTYEDLITEVALYLSIADYSSSGEPDVPLDAADLALCKRHVNNGIRRFLSDAPKQGWRWANPTASVNIWADITGGTNITSAISDLPNNRTLLTAGAAVFYPTMELKTFTFNTGGAAHTIVAYVSPTQIYVSGTAAIPGGGAEFSILSEGAFTLPQSFGGQYTGKITFAAGTNKGIQPRWEDEAQIRLYRADSDEDTGVPYIFAVRIINGTRRRFELVCWRKPDETYTVLFPYTLFFDTLVNLTDVSPAPYGHDETVKAAALMKAEMDTNGVAAGPQAQNYSACLENSMKIDNLSAPKSLGYAGNPGNRRPFPPQRDWRNSYYQRPDVSFNG